MSSIFYHARVVAPLGLWSRPSENSPRRTRAIRRPKALGIPRILIRSADRTAAIKLARDSSAILAFIERATLVALIASVMNGKKDAAQFSQHATLQKFRRSEGINVSTLRMRVNS